jgi:hypothetical protein
MRRSIAALVGESELDLCGLSGPDLVPVDLLRELAADNKLCLTCAPVARQELNDLVRVGPVGLEPTTTE